MAVFQPSKFFVSRRWLYLSAGLMWGAVGVMLCRLAFTWLAHEAAARAMPLALAGVLAALAIGHFGFSHVADKNIRRIASLRDRTHPLAFQSGMSYLTIVFMMGLGMTLRHSGLPKPYLAVLYEGIGGGLLLASARYYPRARAQRPHVSADSDSDAAA